MQAHAPRSRVLSTNGIALHAKIAGPEDGPLVLMLHGFPECADAWHRQVGPLAERGYLVVAPDQRGYGRSEKPPRTASYRQDVLAADAVGLIDAMGRDKAHVICHDWGGAVGWWLALDHPERVASFCVMNMPHPSVFARALRTRAQLQRSWYIFALQLPLFPEWRLTRDDFGVLIRVMYANTVHKPFTPEEIATYKDAWRQPGAIKAMIAWYRAAVRYPALRPKNRTTPVPTLMIWGKQDRALGFELVAPSIARCDDAKLVVIEDAGHFVQHDAAERVNEALADFLPAIH